MDDMNTDTQGALEETGIDRLLNFTIPDRDCRGRLVRLGPTMRAILSAHNYPPAVTLVLAEAMVLVSLMGGLFKGEGDQLTIQVQQKGTSVERSDSATANGAVSLLVCDYLDGKLRGYSQFDEKRLEELGTNPSLSALFGEAYLAITFDIAATKKRYQGIVPLDGDCLSDSVQAYFAQSEQVPTLIRSAVRVDEDGCVGGGILIQHLPEGEEGRERLHVNLEHPEWEHVSIMAQSIRHEELVDREVSLEALVWRLYHDEREVRIENGPRISDECRCSYEHFDRVLARFPEEDLADMRDENGVIGVNCEFCSRDYTIKR